MKLADHFKESLMIYLEDNKSPLKVEENWNNIFGDRCIQFANRSMKDFFVFEEGDIEKYPDSEFLLDRVSCGYTLLTRFNDFKRPYGFFRKKNSAKEILAQKDIEERFPFKAISKVFHIREYLNEWRFAEERSKEYLNRLKDVPEEEFLNELNKEEN